MESPPKTIQKNNPRIQHLAERHKLGLILTPPPLTESPAQPHSKTIPKINGKILKVGSATFRSNFECGSLGQVCLIGVNSFRVTLDQQSNSNRGNTWFYFAVEGVKGEAHFCISGFTKRSSLYNSGMRLCYRDVKEGRWRRGGTQIGYFRAGEEEERNYEVKFSFFFKSSETSCIEFAYSFPYGLTKLHSLIAHIQQKAKVQTLASSFEGRNLTLLNIGNLASKEVIVLSARVHPGEAVSSFIMEGFLRELTSDSDYANYLRSRFLFKVMPMINVDGVVRGNFRFSASGFDLNRRWKAPSEDHHPEIYYLKEMILRESKEKKVVMFIDMHGHSRKKNVFFYGCCLPTEDILTNFQPKSFPFLMSRLLDAYCYDDCCFTVQQEKEGTARVAMWNELQIGEVFTLEASFCSSQVGSNYSEGDYERMGQKLCEGIAIYKLDPSLKMEGELGKMASFRQKTFEELRNSPHLLKVGNAENSGSDSEPQKGQKTEIIDKFRKDKASKPPLNPPLSKNHRKLPDRADLLSIPAIKGGPNDRNSKHKSQTALQDDKQQITEKHLKELFPPSLKATTEYLKPQLDRYNANSSRSMHNHYNTSKNTAIAPLTFAFQNEEDFYDEEKQEKSKTSLMNGFQGVQYRRVRKMAELHEKSKPEKLKPLQTQTPTITITKANKTDADKPEKSRTIIPRFFTNTQKKEPRKCSVEIFYKRVNQLQPRARSKPNKQILNVMCRGRQIK